MALAEAAPAPLLEARGLVKRYASRGGAWGRMRGTVRALDGVSLILRRGECWGLVGESGAGKSTLVRLLAALDRPDEGEVLYAGVPVLAAPAGERRALRRKVQIVFQDPAASLDPLHRIETAVGEPLLVHRLSPRKQLGTRVGELLESVGLPSTREFLDRQPQELSGGERQRVVLARALACEPEALLLDEPVAALDASVRGQVLNLLVELRERRNLALLFIAHDLRVVGSFCERVGVMLAGRIVEVGATLDVLNHPKHPYTSALLEASATIGAGTAAGAGAASRGSGAADGCGYRQWCPRAQEACKVRPELAESGAGREVACYFPSVH